MFFRTSPCLARRALINQLANAGTGQRCGSTLTSRHVVNAPSEAAEPGLSWDTTSSGVDSNGRVYTPGARRRMGERQAVRDPAIEQQRVEKHLAAMAARGPEAELQRRQKIGDANRGRPPWNKGRRHSPETIEKIKAATAQAMARPDVMARIKESQRTRSVSDSTKEKIGSALRQRWLAANAVLRQQAEELVELWAAGACNDPRAHAAAAKPVAACSALVSAAWARRQDWSSCKLADEWERSPELRERVLSRLAGSKVPAGRPIRRQLPPVMRRTLYPTTEQLQQDFLASAVSQQKGPGSQAAAVVPPSWQSLQGKAKRTREWVRKTVQLAVQEHSCTAGASSSSSIGGFGSHGWQGHDAAVQLLELPELQAAVRAYYSHCVCRQRGGAGAGTAAVTLPELAFIAANVLPMLAGSQDSGGHMEGAAAAAPRQSLQQRRPRHREQYLSLLAIYQAAGVASMALPFQVVL